MATKEVILNAGNPDFDGYINLTVKNEDGTVTRIEKVDVWAELSELEKTLADDQREGTAFLQAVRRYMLVKHGVKVSIWAARDYYNTLNSLMEEAENFFTSVQDSPGSTESTPTDAIPEKSDSSTDSSTASEPKNP